MFLHSIVVVADTLAVGEEIGTAHISKIIAILHMPAVVTCRGHALAPTLIAGFAFLSPDFDALVDGFGESMVNATQNLATVHPPARVVLDAESEVILAGWSPKAGEMRCWHAHKPTGANSYAIKEIMRAGYAPAPFADGTFPVEPQTTADHVAVARLQVERMQKDGFAAGGDLVIATLTRDGVAIEIVRSFA